MQSLPWPLARVTTNASPARKLRCAALSRIVREGRHDPRQCSRRGRSGGGRWSGPSRHLLGGARSSQTPAHAAPVQPLPWLCRWPPVGSSPCRAARQPLPQTPAGRAGPRSRVRACRGRVAAKLRNSRSPAPPPLFAGKAGRLIRGSARVGVWRESGAPFRAGEIESLREERSRIPRPPHRVALLSVPPCKPPPCSGPPNICRSMLCSGKPVLASSGRAGATPTSCHVPCWRGLFFRAPAVDPPR